jgi:hypothetical protein
VVTALLPGGADVDKGVEDVFGALHSPLSVATQHGHTDEESALQGAGAYLEEALLHGRMYTWKKTARKTVMPVDS